MMSKIPGDLRKLGREILDAEIARIGVIAELDAINLYEQLAAMTRNGQLRKVLLDIAKEEKTHVGEFLEMLRREDAEQVKELLEGKKEIEEILG
ncbi:MAG: rubrerythrin [Thermoproteota archaeon]|nr:MAG: rubrerythrin [Candidatus Korarchaeota archaeon]